MQDQAPPPDFTTEDTWRIFRIMAEFVEGFETLSKIPQAVTVFGSARTRPGDPEYRRAEELGRALAKAGHAVITGGGPGDMEAVSKGAFEAGGQSIGVCIELPREEKPNPYLTRVSELPLLLRAEGDVREVHEGVRDPARRLRHPRRALRGAHARADAARCRPSRSSSPATTSSGRACLRWLSSSLLRRGKIGPEDLSILQRARTTDEVLALVARSPGA